MTDLTPDLASVLPKDAPSVHRRLLAEWAGIRNRRKPALADFDFDGLLELPHEPYQTEHLQRADGRVALRYGRISPTAEDMFKRDFTGSDMRLVLSEPEFRRTADVYQKALETFTPHYWEKMRSFYGSEPLHFLRLILPLVDESGDAKWLLGSFVWYQDRGKQVPDGWVRRSSP